MQLTCHMTISLSIRCSCTVSYYVMQFACVAACDGIMLGSILHDAVDTQHNNISLYNRRSCTVQYTSRYSLHVISHAVRYVLHDAVKMPHSILSLPRLCSASYCNAVRMHHTAWHTVLCTDSCHNASSNVPCEA